MTKDCVDQRPRAQAPAVPDPSTLDEIQKLRSDYRQALYALRHTEGAYSHFIPRGLLDMLGKKDIQKVHLGDETEKRMTVMFTDIRNFTTLSEGMSSQQTFEFINDYLSHIEPPIERHGGIVDKFIGDAVMAIFPNHARDAVKAALTMREALDHYNSRRVEAGQDEIHMGIGLNTGIVTLGVIGHLERMEATVIGDSVNVAQRLESLTKTYQVGILISENTLANIDNPDEISIRFVDRVSVKGRLRPISVYEVFDGDPSDLAQAKIRNLEIFERAVAYYHLKEIDRATELFELCAGECPRDTVVRIYLDRCRRFLADGVYEGGGELLQHFDWQEAYNLGLPEVDRQHRTLLDNINKLACAMKNDDGAAMDEVFDFLGAYSVEHFSTEERYMRQYGYPFAAEHEQEHKAFIRDFTLTKHEILSGRHDKLISTFRINLYLYDWLINHSTKSDRHWFDFIDRKAGGFRR